MAILGYRLNKTDIHIGNKSKSMITNDSTTDTVLTCSWMAERARVGDSI